MRLTVVALLLIGSAASAAEVLVVQRERRDSMKLFGPAVTQEATETIYYSENKVRTDTEGSSEYTVMDLTGGKEVLYEIDVKEKTYTKTDMAELRKAMEDARKAIDARRKKLAEEAAAGGEENPLAALSGVMGGGAPAPTGPVEVKKTSQTAKIAGYDALLVVFEQEGREAMHVWITDKVKAPELPKDRLCGGSERIGGELLKKRLELEGFELGYWIDLGAVKVEATAKKVERKNVPANFFDVPAGFREAKSEVGSGAPSAPPAKP